MKTLLKVTLLALLVSAGVAYGAKNEAKVLSTLSKAASAIGLTAPSYSDRHAIEGMATSGDIVFESSSDTFYGRTTDDVTKWVPLSAPNGSGQVISSAAVRMDAATGLGGGSCGTITQPGSLVASCAHNSTGNYTLTFTTAFGGTPHCIVTNGNGVGDVGQYVVSASTTAVTIQMIGGGSPVNNPWQLFCLGAQ